MSTPVLFDTPGGLRDFPEGSDFYRLWDAEVNRMLGGAPTPGSGGVGEFYNPRVTRVNPAAERHLVWMGFPRELLARFRDNRAAAFEEGDSRGAGDTVTQNEYLEWRVSEAGGRIKKVTFTTETPEYWRALFGFDRKRCAELYGRLVGDTVSVEDLVNERDEYDPLNKWNTTHGIVHYIVEINTLGDAVGLAAGSVTLGRPAHARDNYELTTEGSSTMARTSADPRVQIDVNALARKGLSLTALEPVGLYIAGWDDAGWTKPDGSPVGDYWRVVRGRHGAALRVEYEVPAGEGFDVSDIRIGGRLITRGGHLAEHLTVTIGGLAGTRPA